MRYLFGDTEPAIRRLHLLAKVLAESSKPLLQESNVGPQLNSMKESVTLEKHASEVRHLKVPTARAATLFFYNIRTWKENLFNKANYSPAAIQQLQSDLNDLRRQPGNESEISWGMRQVVFVSV